ncbi:Rrf2 family transcriptional regulator [Alkalihalobacillus trypoxylicola]|uniref:HTH-type transcriptional regulator NsrR n=1 Tax=Alkalihalobacillus trypoxylicola TaxID=519424 RepID=A0A161PB56_9BACI|nr:Rrf2 family transcriptional regulator [Alkalihalobacillus trypoxylicola]KYG29452.1 Rrf2 family transcriptional regulator [Alkalihalobacillus trypoxylicola]
MQLTSYTDYSLRALIYIGALEQGKRTSIKEISRFYQLSNNHLQKIIHELGKRGYIETIRGRNGGIQMKMDPNDINVGQLVRETEDLNIVECFNQNHNCVISSVCKLKSVLYQANEAFLQVLDQYTLADLMMNKEELSRLLFSERS